MENELELSENQFRCYDCDEVFNNDEGQYNFQDKLVYQDCFDDNNFYCESCENTHSKDDLRVTDSGRYLCINCYDDEYTSCYNCDVELLIDSSNTYYHERQGNYYCEDCYPRDVFEHEANNFERIGSLTQKYPHNRFVGVELEVENAGQIHDKGNNNYKSIPQEIKDYWNFKEDGSLENDGLEVTSVKLKGDAIDKSIKEMTEFLNKHDAEITKRCGFHVHIDSKGLNDTDIRKIYLVYASLMPYLEKMVSVSRRNNHYCKTIYHNEDILTSTKHRLKGHDLNDRYRALNLLSLQRHGTIEIRLHQGTTDYEKITKWIRINLNIFEYAIKQDFKRLLNFKPDLNAFLHIIKDKDLICWYKQRVTEFMIGTASKNKFKLYEDKLPKKIMSFQQQTTIINEDNLNYTMNIRKFYDFLDNLIDLSKITITEDE